MRIALYTQEIPTTPFIEQQIHALANQGNQILVFGRLKKGQTIPDNNSSIQYNIQNNGNLYKYIKFIQYIISGIFHLNEIKYWWNHIKISDFKLKISKFNLIYSIVRNRPEVIHIQWAKSIKDIEELIQSKKIKTILSLRGTQINVSPQTNQYYKNLYQKNFPYIHQFHGVCQNIIHEASLYDKDLPNRTSIIYPAVNEKNISTLTSYPYESMQKNMQIIVIGRPHWIKGYEYLYRTMKLLKDEGLNFQITLIVQEKLPIEDLYLINEWELTSYIKIIQHMKHDFLLNELKKYHVLIQPSLMEGVSNVVLEAMSQGVPVISNNIGGMSEVIHHMQNGLLFSQDKNQLKDTIIQFKNLSPQTIQNMRESALQTILKGHTLKQSTILFETLYQN